MRVESRHVALQNAARKFQRFSRPPLRFIWRNLHNYQVIIPLCFFQITLLCIFREYDDVISLLTWSLQLAIFTHSKNFVFRNVKEVFQIAEYANFRSHRDYSKRPPLKLLHMQAFNRRVKFFNSLREEAIPDNRTCQPYCSYWATSESSK